LGLNLKLEIKRPLKRMGMPSKGGTLYSPTKGKKKKVKAILKFLMGLRGVQ